MGGAFFKGTVYAWQKKSTTTTVDTKPASASKLGVGTKLERHSLSEMPRCRRRQADRLALGLHIKSHEQINDIILRRAGARRLGMLHVLLAQGITQFREYKGADSARHRVRCQRTAPQAEAACRRPPSARSTSSTRSRTTSKTTQKGRRLLVSASLTLPNELVQLIRASDGDSEAAPHWPS